MIPPLKSLIRMICQYLLDNYIMQIQKESTKINEKKLGRIDRFLRYLILYLFIALTSVPFFVGDEYLVLGFLLSFVVFIYKRYIVDRFIIFYCLIFFIIMMAQSLFFLIFESNVILGYFFRIIYAYMTIRILGNKIGDYYVNIIYFFSIISLLIFIPSIFFYEIIDSTLTLISFLFEPFQLHDPGRSHIIIYTFGENYEDVDGDLSKSLFRNSGPFWEPGGFGVFLILAIIFEIIKHHKLLTKRNIVFIISLLTTLSTGAFFVLFILIVFYILTYPTPLKMVSLGAFVLISALIYSNTFFLTEKVNKQTSKTSVSLASTPRNRFVSGQLDLIDFINNPILGRGRFDATRFDTKENLLDPYLNHRNNGTTNLLVEFGIFGFITFFYFMYKSFKAYCIENKFKTVFAVYLVVLMLGIGFSQMIFIKPFFIGLSFLFLAAKSMDRKWTYV